MAADFMCGTFTQFVLCPIRIPMAEFTYRVLFT